jgi:hypothetical protein
VQLEELVKVKKFNYLIGPQTHDLPACSIAPQPSMLTACPNNEIMQILKCQMKIKESLDK